MPNDGVDEEPLGDGLHLLRIACDVPWRVGCELMAKFGYRRDFTFGSTAVFVGEDQSLANVLLLFKEGRFGQRDFARREFVRALMAAQRATGRRKLLTLDELEAAATGPLDDDC